MKNKCYLLNKKMIEDEFINCKYNQIKFLGKGSFGKVILAEDKITKSNVAVKYIDFFQMCEYERDKILQEGQILFKVNHKNIIRFENFFFNKSRAILIMEYAEGGDLDKKIKSQILAGYPFKEDKIISWFLELCEVIKYLHTSHILHRDLKPLNIFLTIDNHIKLGDFGISKILISTNDLTTAPAGTLIYMSPEAIKEEHYSYSCDIWSLGIILFELCLLKNPLIDLNDKKAIKEYILNGDFEKLINEKNIKENYSEKICDLIKKILVKNPTERPTIDELIKECKDILYDCDSKNKKLERNISKILENNLFPKNEETKSPKRSESSNNLPEDDCENILRETMAKFILEGFKIINDKIIFNPNLIKYGEANYKYYNGERKEKNINKSFERKNGKGLDKKEIFTPKPVKKSNYEYTESNRDAPPVQLLQQPSLINLADNNNIHNSKNYINNKNFEDYTPSNESNNKKKYNSNNKNNKEENNYNGEERYEKGKNKESNNYENESGFCLFNNF